LQYSGRQVVRDDPWVSAPAQVTDVWSRNPIWLRPRVLEVIVQTCVVLAWGTELVRVTVSGHPAGGYVAVVVSVAGVALARRVPKPGLVVIGAAPLTAAALGWDPIVTWTVAVFAVFVHTLGGAPATSVGVVPRAREISGAPAAAEEDVDHRALPLTRPVSMSARRLMTNPHGGTIPGPDR
jgi:hypothetical protein